MNDHLSKEALESLDGKVLPVVIGEGKDKRTIGVGTLQVVEGDLRMEGEITDPAALKILFGGDPSVSIIEKPDER